MVDGQSRCDVALPWTPKILHTKFGADRTETVDLYSVCLLREVNIHTRDGRFRPIDCNISKSFTLINTKFSIKYLWGPRMLGTKFGADWIKTVGDITVELYARTTLAVKS